MHGAGGSVRRLCAEVLTKFITRSLREVGLLYSCIGNQSDSSSVHNNLDIRQVGHNLACYVAVPRELPFFVPAALVTPRPDDGSWPSVIAVTM